MGSRFRKKPLRPKPELWWGSFKDVRDGTTGMPDKAMKWGTFVRQVSDQMQLNLVRSLHGQGPWRLYSFEYSPADGPTFHFVLHSGAFGQWLAFDVGDADGPWGISVAYAKSLDELDHGEYDSIELGFTPFAISVVDNGTRPGETSYYAQEQVRPTAMLLTAAALMYINDGNSKLHADDPLGQPDGL